jgi:hypothetical protein
LTCWFEYLIALLPGAPIKVLGKIDYCGPAHERSKTQRAVGNAALMVAPRCLLEQLELSSIYDRARPREGNCLARWRWPLAASRTLWPSNGVRDRWSFALVDEVNQNARRWHFSVVPQIQLEPKMRTGADRPRPLEPIGSRPGPVTRRGLNAR